MDIIKSGMDLIDHVSEMSDGYAVDYLENLAVLCIDKIRNYADGGDEYIEVDEEAQRCAYRALINNGWEE